MNDPVMGGQSYSNYSIDKDSGIAKWIGEVKIVPSLSAPGFCNFETQNPLASKFNDASPYTHLEIRIRSFEQYSGYKVSFAADTLNPQFKSFKAPFNVTGDGNWYTVAIPFSEFSNDWSPYTGDCFTKDPTGKQHVCCTSASTDVCPTTKNLKDIEQLGIWMEGSAGKFHVEIEWVRAGFGDTCSIDEYCCPDAQLCLTPSNISCKDDEKVCDGTDHPVCCPLTKLCVKPGNPCTTPCADAGDYCCPDAKACLKPTNPGVLCGTNSDCGSSEVCCPLTKICVAPGNVCKPFDDPAAPFWPASDNLVDKISAQVVGKNTCVDEVQSHLLYNMSGRFDSSGLPIDLAEGEDLVTAICCDSAFKPFAEPTGFFQRPDVNFFGVLDSSAVTTFYDPVCGIPLFNAPVNRTFADFKADTEEHGWPSFRAAEVIADHVKIDTATGEVLSACGTHLGSYLPDEQGPRYCMDLSCVSGQKAN
jgi:hypothetical protein